MNTGKKEGSTMVTVERYWNGMAACELSSRHRIYDNNETVHVNEGIQYTNLNKHRNLN